MTIVSKLQLNHPSLGTAGGAGLHSSIESLYTKIGDNMADRWFSLADFDQAETVDLEHNFETDISNLRYDLYNYTGGEWVRLTADTSPARSAFSVIEKVGFEDTILQITNNTGGNNLTFAVCLTFDSVSLVDNDVKDIDIVSTTPEDGQALVYEASTKKFKPGASGDSSFKLQGVTDPSVTIKGGYLILDDGREIATYDGAGTAATDFGTDIVVNLDTVLGSNPANATTYYLYLNLLTLGSEVTIDNGRKVYSIAAADTSKFYLSTIKPEAIKKTQYAVIGFIKSATTGTVWSGSGAAFGTIASKKFNQRQVDGVNYLFDFYNANSLGTVGTALVGDTDTRNTNNFLSWQSTNTANISLVESATSPLRSPNNYLFTGSGNAIAGTTFVESPAFQLHVADLGKPVMVSFDIADVTADGNFDVIMVRYNSSGAYQEKISIAGNASGANQPSAKLPTGISKFNGFFIASSTSTDYYALRFRRLAGTDVPRLDSIKVSPEQVIQGASITDWQSYTPSSTQGFGTPTAFTLQWKQVGDSIKLRGGFTTGTCTAVEARVSLPNGYTIGGLATASQIAGLCERTNSTASQHIPVLATSGNNFIQFGNYSRSADTNTLVAANASAIFANAEVLSLFSVDIPISTLTSSVTMANRAVEEYASNSGTWDAQDLTSFSYGISGSPMGGALTANRNKQVRFQSPILETDTITLEINMNSTGNDNWFSAEQLGVGYLPFPTVPTGVGILDQIGSTDLLVSFSQYARPGTTYNSATGAANWSTGSWARWRVRKVSGGASVGYPVSARNIVGDVSGTTVPSGYIGEKISVTLTPSTLTGSYADVSSSLTLTKGVWMIYAAFTLYKTAHSTAYCIFKLRDTTTPTDLYSYSWGTQSTATAMFSPHTIAVYVNHSNTRSYVLQAYDPDNTSAVTFAANTGGVYGQQEFFAIRIA